MKKYKHMEQEQEWWTLADAIERGEQRNKALLQEEYREGKEQGIKEGKTLTQQKILKSQIELKFKVDASNWINTLDSETMDKAALLLLSCDSFDELKKQTTLEV